MMKKSNINQRISQIIDSQFNKNRKKFAEHIGFSPQVISNIVAGRKSKPSFDVLNSIISTIDDIDPMWLLTGSGNMFKKDSYSSLKEDPEGIPLIPLDAMAGFGEGELQVMDYEPKRYRVPEFDALKADYLIRVKGNSMAPHYQGGDIVACRTLPLTDLFFQWNKVYVLDTQQGPLIKRIHKSDKKEHIRCISENKDYDPFDIPIKIINALAIVVGVIRLE